MLVFHLQSGDSSDTSLGVRSVALLQVAKWSRARSQLERDLRAIESPEMSWLSILCIAQLPHYGDSSGAILGVRSVALLQVPKLIILFCDLNEKKFNTILATSKYYIAA